MASVDYIYDDDRAARAFVLSLKLKTIRERFSSVNDWKPDHSVLAVVNGIPVALADCNVSADSVGAVGGLIARPNFGGYAVSALAALKRQTQLRHWAAAVRAPNPAVFGIARRFLDEPYDQGAWEVANELMLINGPLAHLRPTPLVISTFHLKHLQLPPLRTWSATTKRQVLEAARSPGTINLVAPSGDNLGPLMMTLAFELANTPVPVRQHMTRTLMFMMMTMHGFPVPQKMARKFIAPSAPREFQQSIDLTLASLDVSGKTLFLTQRMRGAAPWPN